MERIETQALITCPPIRCECSRFIDSIANTIPATKRPIEVEPDGENGLISNLSVLGVATAWITVIQMLRYKGGFRAPEEMKRTPLNLDPKPDQTEPKEPVERYRRIMQNHLENLPFFLVIGLLFVLTAPSLTLARWLLFDYVTSRLLHFIAYASAQIHDIRATFWTIGSIILIAMSVMVLQAGLSAV